MPNVSETYIENRQRVQSAHTNNHASAHGGNVLRWMDEIGAMLQAGVWFLHIY